MSTIKTRFRSLVAVVAAAALALVAAVLVIPTAGAATTGNIDPNAKGSITVHKYQNPAKGKGSIDANGGVTGTPLEGVEFTVTPVKNVDLKTNEGWAKLKGLNVADVEVDEAQAQKITTQADGSAATPELAIGVYKVSETNTAGAKANGKAVKVATKAADFLVSIPMSKEGQWIYNVHVFPKNTVLTNDNKPVKTVTDATKAYFPGDTITWQIKQTLPDPGPNTEFSTYKIVDTLLAGVETITPDKVKVTKNDAPVEGVTSVDPAGKVVTVEFTDDKLKELKANDVIVVTISAVVSADASELSNQADVTVNDVTVKTTKDPNGDDDTPTVTQFVDLTIKKINSKNQPLKEATFTITPVDQANVPVPNATVKTVTTAGDAGQVVQRLAVGRYLLTETKAPVGYEIADAYKQGKVIDVSPAGLTETVTNLSADESGTGLLPNLPLTGAQGAVLLTIIGVALVAVAVGTGLVVVRRRRQD